MGTSHGTGEMPAIPEDTLDLGDRLDPVRTLLRRTASGDRGAAGALVDVLGPRIHGLGVHMTGSSVTAGRLTVAVLRSCLRDAGQLAASGLPGEAAVLDRARRAAVATRPTGDVRSLVAPAAVEDRTRDRREVAVMRALLALPPAQRALVESAAQGRFPYTGQQRRQAAGVLAQLLDSLVPFGDLAGQEAPSSPMRSLAALDALGLADDEERAHLRSLSAGTEAAGAHRHAIEAAARLSLLTAVAPSRDLREAVLDGFEAIARPAPVQAPVPSPGPEPAYHGTYATPVLGTDTQRRLVGPPAVVGGSRPAAPVPVPAPPPAAAAHPGVAGPTPAFAYSAHDDAGLTRRRRRQARARERAQAPHSPWPARLLGALAVLTLAGGAVMSGLYLDQRARAAEERAFGSTWTELSVQEDARPVPGLSDNGTWRAVLTEDQAAVWAEGVSEYRSEGGQDEVLQLWGQRDGLAVDLGVLEVEDGSVRVMVPEGVESLTVTREYAPQNLSGTPSQRIVATLDPELSGT